MCPYHPSGAPLHQRPEVHSALCLCDHQTATAQPNMHKLLAVAPETWRRVATSLASWVHPHSVDARGKLLGVLLGDPLWEYPIQGPCMAYKQICVHVDFRVLSPIPTRQHLERHLVWAVHVWVALVQSLQRRERHLVGHKRRLETPACGAEVDACVLEDERYIHF